MNKFNALSSILRIQNQIDKITPSAVSKIFEMQKVIDNSTRIFNSELMQSSLNSTRDLMSSPVMQSSLNSTRALMSSPVMQSSLNSTIALMNSPVMQSSLNSTIALMNSPVMLKSLNFTAAILSSSLMRRTLNQSATILSTSMSLNSINQTKTVLDSILNASSKLGVDAQLYSLQSKIKSLQKLQYDEDSTEEELLHFFSTIYDDKSIFDRDETAEKRNSQSKVTHIYSRKSKKEILSYINTLLTLVSIIVSTISIYYSCKSIPKSTETSNQTSVTEVIDQDNLTDIGHLKYFLCEKKIKKYRILTRIKLRSKPNTRCTVISYLGKDEEVQLLRKNGKWANILYMNGLIPVTGYVLHKYLKNNKIMKEIISESGS